MGWLCGCRRASTNYGAPASSPAFFLQTPRAAKHRRRGRRRSIFSAPKRRAETRGASRVVQCALDCSNAGRFASRLRDWLRRRRRGRCFTPGGGRGRRRAGSRCSARVPGALLAVTTPLASAADAIRRAYEARFRPQVRDAFPDGFGKHQSFTLNHLVLRGWLNSGSNCPPCEDDGALYAYVKSVGLIAICPPIFPSPLRKRGDSVRRIGPDLSPALAVRFRRKRSPALAIAEPERNWVVRRES
jgi:hypothetical protein